MKLHELISVNNKDVKRVGRGTGSGMGKTSGRGTKGQNSRSGGGVKPGFEGGQMKLAMRLPKLKGFKSRNEKAQIINLDNLNSFDGKINKKALLEKGLILTEKRTVKILGRGKLEKKDLLIEDIEKVSKSAESAIISLGGKINKKEK